MAPARSRSTPVAGTAGIAPLGVFQTVSCRLVNAEMIGPRLCQDGLAGWNNTLYLDGSAR